MVWVEGLEPPTHTMTDHRPATPEQALRRLEQGHQRFRTGALKPRDLSAEVERTAEAQSPTAVVLSCMDSRVTPERIFDQGVGSLLCIRVAGNTVSDEVLGNLEFACEVLGASLILVMGHTRCGAVRAACEAVGQDPAPFHEGLMAAAADTAAPNPETPLDPDHLAAVARSNVERALAGIRDRSAALRGRESAGTLLLRGALYDVGDGTVSYQD